MNECTWVPCSGAVRRIFFLISYFDQPRDFAYPPVLPYSQLHVHGKNIGVAGVLRSLWTDRARPECPSGLAIQIQCASAAFPLRYVHSFGFESRSCLDIVYGNGW